MNDFTDPSAKHVPTETKSLNNGEQHVFKFPNGWQASVIRGPYSYGGSSGQFELAVLDRDGHLNYDTPVTDDVIGHIPPSDLDAILDQVAALDEAP